MLITSIKHMLKIDCRYVITEMIIKDFVNSVIFHIGMLRRFLVSQLILTKLQQ